MARILYRTERQMFCWRATDLSSGYIVRFVLCGIVFGILQSGSTHTYPHFAHNCTLYVIFWKKYVQRRPNATTAIVAFTKVNVERIFLIFSASMGGQKGPVFYIYYERITGHRSKLKIFCQRGFHFTPLFLRLLWGHMKAMPENFPCQTTEK